MTDFNGLTAVVTGAASGIGLAAARGLADRGASVAALDLEPSTVPEPILGVRCDVSDDAAVAQAIASVAHRFGGIDILVNNAGVGAVGDIAANELEEWRRVLDINLLGVVRVSRAALPWLRQSKHAAVVNVCSIAATAGLPHGLSTRRPRALSCR